MKELSKQRLLELRADNAIFGLNEEEMREFEQLKKHFPEWEDDFSLEITAAAINLSNLKIDEAMPLNLREKIALDAENYFDSSDEKKLEETSPAQSFYPVRDSVEPTSSRPFWQWFGWAVAAAACLALAINIWTTRSATQNDVVQKTETIQTPAPEMSAAQKREQLLAAAKDVVQINFADPKNEKQIIGDAVWSNAEQKGFAHFKNLPPLDSAKETYQIWIFDEAQNEKYPIDGGVFEVDKNGEVIVPIDAGLKVKKPKMIAVTKEKAGGVVVSSRKNLVAVAKI